MNPNDNDDSCIVENEEKLESERCDDSAEDAGADSDADEIALLENVTSSSPAIEPVGINSIEILNEDCASRIPISSMDMRVKVKTRPFIWFAMNFVAITVILSVLVVSITLLSEKKEESEEGPLHMTFSDGVPSVGCSAGRANLPWGELTGLRTVRGTSRTFMMLYPPKPAESSAPLPVVIDFHGWGDSASFEAASSGYEHLLERKGGFIAVFPNGENDVSSRYDKQKYRSWNVASSSSSPQKICDPLSIAPGPCYTSCSERGDKNCNDRCNWSTCVNDILFVENLLDELEETHCIDRSRIFATGMSNGAMFLFEIASGPLANRFAAIAPVSGLPHPGFGEPSHPLPVIYIHGRNDETIPPVGAKSGDATVTNGHGWFYTSLPSSACRFALTNYNYPSSSNKTLCKEVAWRSRYAAHESSMSCKKVFPASEQEPVDEAAKVVFCMWDGGHDWPSNSAFVSWEFLSHFKRSIAD